ncbi:MAG: polysaccharide deacetylase family protein [Nitrospirae bacterium]|nr:polysaccharide deacetylase family protein [Nitrospirota bacterium]
MKKFITFVIAVLLISSCSSLGRKDSSQEKGFVPLLTFIFDDGNDTDYSIAKEVFKQHNATAGFAITTGWLNTKNHLSISQLQELQNDCFEIMSHTVSHPDLKSLDDKQIESELSASKAALEGLGIKVKNIVYPYNKNNSHVKDIVSKYYRSARGGRSMLNPAELDRYELKSYSFSHNTKKMKALIDIAFIERKWLIIYHHNIDIKVRVSPGNSGSFLPGEELLFSPSGARGRYSKELFSWLYYVPVSGTPHTGDTIAGQASGATSYLIEILYNEIEELGELIDYAHSSYPDMKIVTIDQGLDIYNIK